MGNLPIIHFVSVVHLCLVIRSPFTASQDFGAAWRVVDSIREVPALLAA